MTYTEEDLREDVEKASNEAILDWYEEITDYISLCSVYGQHVKSREFREQEMLKEEMLKRMED
jgi:hypothetical protein